MARLQPKPITVRMPRELWLRYTNEAHRRRTEAGDSRASLNAVIVEALEAYDLNHKQGGNND